MNKIVSVMAVSTVVGSLALASLGQATGTQPAATQPQAAGAAIKWEGKMQSAKPLLAYLYVREAKLAGAAPGAADPARVLVAAWIKEGRGSISAQYDVVSVDKAGKPGEKEPALKWSVHLGPDVVMDGVLRAAGLQAGKPVVRPATGDIMLRPGTEAVLGECTTAHGKLVLCVRVEDKIQWSGEAPAIRSGTLRPAMVTAKVLGEDARNGKPEVVQRALWILREAAAGRPVPAGDRLIPMATDVAVAYDLREAEPLLERISELTPGLEPAQRLLEAAAQFGVLTPTLRKTMKEPRMEETQMAVAAALTRAGSAEARDILWKAYRENLGQPQGQELALWSNRQMEEIWDDELVARLKEFLASLPAGVPKNNVQSVLLQMEFHRPDRPIEELWKMAEDPRYDFDRIDSINGLAPRATVADIPRLRALKPWRPERGGEGEQMMHDALDKAILQIQGRAWRGEK